MNNPKTSIINEITYIYKLNNNSITHNPFQNKMQSLEIHILVIKKVIEESIANNCDKNLINNYLKTKEKYLKKISTSLSNDDKGKLNFYLHKYNLDDLIIIH